MVWRTYYPRASMRTRIYPVQCAWELGDGETKDYTVDLANEVGEGESITNTTWESDPDDLAFTNPSQNGTQVTVFISGAKAETPYHILVTCTTGTGKTVQVPLLVGGVNKRL